MVRWLLLALMLLQAPTVQAADGEITPQERYELGLRYAKRSNYTKALEQFNRLRNYHRDDPVSVLAELAIADLYYKQGEYEQARYAYEDFARLHPRHEDMDLVQFRLGLSIYKRAPKVAQRDQTATRQALSTWAGFATRFPNSEHIEEVEKLSVRCRDRLATRELAIARFYATRKAWGAVRGRAEGVITRYPDTALVPDALVLAATAAHAWGDTRAATRYRDRLATDFPDAPGLARVDRALARSPGQPPEDELFKRPFRVNGGAAAQQPQR